MKFKEVKESLHELIDSINEDGEFSVVIDYPSEEIEPTHGYSNFKNTGEIIIKITPLKED